MVLFKQEFFVERFKIIIETLQLYFFIPFAKWILIGCTRLPGFIMLQTLSKYAKG